MNNTPGRWRSYAFWRPGRVITMATPNINYEPYKSQIFIKSPFVWVNNWKGAEAQNQIFRTNLFTLTPTSPSLKLRRLERPPGVPHHVFTFLELMQHSQLPAMLSDLYHCKQCELPAVSINPEKKFRVRVAKVAQTRRCEPKVSVRSRCDQISFLGHQVIQLL